MQVLSCGYAKDEPFPVIVAPESCCAHHVTLHHHLCLLFSEYRPTWRRAQHTSRKPQPARGISVCCTIVFLHLSCVHIRESTQIILHIYIYMLSCSNLIFLLLSLFPLPLGFLLQLAFQVLNFLMIIFSALMIWKGLMCYTGSESPIVVVLSGSMEPAFYRGDLWVTQPLRITAYLKPISRGRCWSALFLLHGALGRVFSELLCSEPDICVHNLFASWLDL